MVSAGTSPEVALKIADSTFEIVLLVANSNESNAVTVKSKINT